MNSVRLGAAAGCAIALLAVRPVTSQLPVRAVVAVVEEAGLYPIARFDGAVWVNTWPTPDEPHPPERALDRLPASWLGGPIPESWTEWTSSGVRVGAVRVTQAAVVRGGCDEPLALSVDRPLRSEATLAIAGDAAIGLEPVATAPETDSSLRSYILALVASRQTSILNARKRWQPGERERLERTLAGATTEISPLVGVRQPDGMHLVFFSATKRGKGASALADGVYLHGWLRVKPSGKVDAIGRIDVVRADGDESIDTWRALGVARISSREYWFIDNRRYEGRRFLTFEVGPGGVRQLIDASYGGC